MMRLIVVDRDGVEHAVEALPTGTLMEALRELDYGVAAICGGMCSCATCHIYVDSAWAPRVPPQQRDESALISELQHRRETSRLACQIQMRADLEGLRVTLAPDE
jgi:ferredoxin, 2Fe-2S